MGLLKLNNGPLEIGDELLVIGSTTGVLRCGVESMEVDGVGVSKVEKGDSVGVRLPKCRKGDEVYRVVKR